MNSFYSRQELLRLGLKAVGDNVSLSRKASLYSPEGIELGHHVRIDDFCILSGKIRLGSHVHISAYTVLFGCFGITVEDYAGLSPRCTVLSASDDFSGRYLSGATLDAKFRNATTGTVQIGRFAAVGASCVIFPGVTIGEGTAVGAMSLVNRSLPPWGIYAGIPARFLKERSRDMLDFLK